MPHDTEELVRALQDDVKVQRDLNDVGDALGSTHETLADGLPGGADEEWGYDAQLVAEIAEACRRWKARVG